MTQTPSISILMPVFNAASTLEAALESVLRQSRRDFECILVDDGSTDLSSAMIAEYCRRDARFVAATGAHCGIVETLNHGIALCRGRYVARFDADDVMHPERLERQCDALDAEPGWAGLGCHVRLFPRETLTSGRVAYETWLNSLRTAEAIHRDRFVECPLAHPTLMLRQERLETLGYREVPWAEDYDLVLRLFALGHTLGTVPEPLLQWRDGRARLSRTSERYSQAQFVACKAQFLVEDWLKDEPRYVLWGYGSTGKALCRALGRLGRHPAAIVEVHPGRVGQRIAGAPVIAPSAIEAWPKPRPKLIVSVAGEGPRADVRATAAELGLVEGTDYVCAA